MVTQLTQQYYTPAQYLEFEAEADNRHEFCVDSSFSL